MSPFLNEEDFDDYSEVIEAPKIEREPRGELSFLKNDRKFFLIGGVASFVAFISVIYFLYSNSKPVSLDDLPLIKADPTPIKVRPQNNAQVKHQDKTVYDNISGDIAGRDEEERVISQPEEVLSITEMDSDGVLSAEEKRKIISAFDDLAPADAEKEYRINYVRNGKGEGVSKDAEKGRERFVEGLKIVEDDPSLPPIKRNIEADRETIFVEEGAARGKTTAVARAGKRGIGSGSSSNGDFNGSKTNNVKATAKSIRGVSGKKHSKIADLLGQQVQKVRQDRKDRRDGGLKFNQRLDRGGNQSSNRQSNQRANQQLGQQQSNQSSNQQRFSIKSYANHSVGGALYNSGYDSYGRHDNKRHDSQRNGGGDSGVMVQIGSVPTKSGAESEYRRLANKNRFIKNYGRRIYKVDLGRSKGSRYRIQLGPFRSNAEAQKVVSDLERNGCSAYVSR